MAEKKALTVQEREFAAFKAGKAAATGRRRRRKAASVGLFQLGSFAAAIAEATHGRYFKNQITDEIRNTEKAAILRPLGVPDGPLAGLGIGVIGEASHTAANRAHVNPGISLPGVITVRLI